MLTGGTLPQLYPLIMAAAMVTGALLSRRYKSALPLNNVQKLWIGLCAFSAAILGARLPFLIPGVPGFADAGGILFSGRTILFGMVGGYFGVELAKWWIGLTIKTGDTFVVPVAASIAVGRLGCFCVGCCYGTPTDVPWGIQFPKVDDLFRHPTQLYEFVFHLTAALFCAWCIRQRMFQGQLIKLYFIAYFCYRFVTEMIRPEARLLGGLSAYQWSALFLIALFVWLWRRDAATLAGLRSDSSLSDEGI